ncbi:TIR domain-containing protein [Sulfuricurvum sp.]|uniref:toll/interleukin-1 receptor domain-containing protein n=1 Tax=Sulfuricurvum sp. TaxID=2025608 RepID=UPI002610DB6C|nr:TIR domain-containing protein [Sulfuricurvum sp.]MDD3594824.1 TIR domain-containing protein [Sulfuricurvum sp.]
MNDIKTFDYQIALSFAGENRDFVEEVAHLLKAYGVKVFYDKFEEANLWGKNLFDYLQSVYKEKAQYTVLFASEAYARKVWTNHERRSMQERALLEAQEYILPVRFDETEIPGLYSSVSYIDLREKSPFDLTKLILEKIGWETHRRWWGTWSIDSGIPSYGGILKIEKVTSHSFDFELDVFKGAHMGSISGTAQLLSSNEAVYIDVSVDENNPCKLQFIKFNDTIQILENEGCRTYHGVRAHFFGDYRLQKDIFFEYIPLRDAVLSSIYSILKHEKWERFLQCFADTFEENNEDMFDAQVISAGIPGLYTICEAILMYTEDGKVWGAYLDDEKIYYFSSESVYKESLPKTIETWSKKFSKEIIFIG